MSPELASREEARAALRVYMMRTGMGLRDLAWRTGFAHRSLVQFMSAARYGDGEGQFTAGRLMDYLEANPWEPPALPGRLYETESTREMDSLIAYCRRGRWATLYGPAGSQKSFLLEYRAAEAAREPEPGFVWLPIPGRMTPCGMLRLIATGSAAAYAQGSEGLRQNILYRVRSRRTPLVIAFDEMDLIYKDVDALEVVRRLGDALRGRLGIIVAGNEQISELFRPRRDRYFEQWRSRIQQKELRVLGPTREEAREIVRAELGEAKDEAITALVDDCTVNDPKTKKRYVSARRLFNSLDHIKERRAARKAN